MIRRTHAFLTAQRAHWRPVVLVYLTSNMTRRVYGAITPDSAIGGGMETWNGVYSVGDGGTFGSEIGVSDAQARVLQFGSLKQQLLRNTKDILTSLSQSESPINQITLDNHDGYFSRLLSAAYGESFINQLLEIKVGFHGLAAGDYLTIAKGTVLEEKLSQKTLVLSYVGLTASVFETWELPNSSLFENPADDNAVLPILIGDLTENTPAQGIVACPCIDTINHVYACAGNPINNSHSDLYDGNGDPLSWSYITGGWEGLAGMVYGSFVVCPAKPVEPVSIKCWGAAPYDNLITNPLDVLRYLFDLAGEATEFEQTSYTRARAYADAQGYTCAGVLNADNSLAYWLTAILSSFLGSWYINADNKIVVTFLSDTSQRQNVDGMLLERNYIASPIATRTHATLCNQPIINYAYSADRSDKRFKNDASTYYLMTDDGSAAIDAESVRLYGERKITLNLNFCRNTETVNDLQEYIVSVYGQPIWELPITEQGFDNLHVEIGDPLLFSWRDLRDTENLPVTNQIGWVLQKNINLDALTVEWQLLDTGEYLNSTPEFWDGTGTVGDGGTFGNIRRRDIAV